MKILIQFSLAAILIPVIDFIWLSKLMSGFYLSELGPLARTEGGQFKPMIAPAIGVYLVMALGIVLFVLPKAETSVGCALFYGACLGLCIYGVYDLTNLSLIQNWSLKLTVVDIAWGTFLCGIVSMVTHLCTRRM